jgi:hypothetical protein
MPALTGCFRNRDSNRRRISVADVSTEAEAAAAGTLLFGDGAQELAPMAEQDAN